MKKFLATIVAVVLLFAFFATGCGANCVHEYGEWRVTTVPTCTVAGVKESMCSLCGDIKQESVAAAHNKYSPWTVEENEHYKVCKTCKEKFDEGEHALVEGRCECGKKEDAVMSVLEIPDYIVEVEEGREARVLFLADTQIIDSSQMRHPDRLPGMVNAWAPENMEELCFKYIRKAVQTVNPDLIILMGDNIYGEFDDRGTSLLKLIEVMDSFQIPWGLVNGNHDNESIKGAKWQNAQYEAAEYCLYKKGDTDGNGNYTIAIKQGAEITRMFYLMDSNYCTYADNAVYNEVVTSCGFTQNQVKWMYDRMAMMEEVNGAAVKSTLCFHIATNEYAIAGGQYSTQNGDFGTAGQTTFDNYYAPSAYGKSFIEICKQFSVDSTFCGHSHKMNTSIAYQGIRWTFCLKTGEYDSHTPSELGGTKMTFNASTFAVEHVYHNSEN